ncbi:MAG TPA: hypothetical protein VM690_01625 [Gaiellaceae bacterium]|nr:hypothetical protein [Gaiellaceae bacterium]
MRRALPFLLVLAVSAAWIRPPDAKTSMDTNPANLASAVVTHAFGQLPAYIDEANFRLLPIDLFRGASPGATVHRLYRLALPRTSLVLDTVVTSGLTSAQAREDARQYSVAVSIDGLRVPQPDRYWVFYRNNGPLICRIYFPGDLGSLNMGAHSLVIEPFSPGVHRVHVVVRQRLTRGVAVIVTDYALRVLPRKPNARERESAPPESANPTSLGNTPLTFRTPKG